MNELNVGDKVEHSVIRTARSPKAEKIETKWIGTIEKVHDNAYTVRFNKGTPKVVRKHSVRKI